jgi:mono/diheme cytochrome c family protein
VSRPTRSRAVCVALLGLALAGCGEVSRIEVAEDSPEYRGAVLFNERCSGCHTLTAAGAVGSNLEGETASYDRTNGPNLDQRVESVDDVLFAIRNGGFSGAIMPANIVVGQDAQDVAEFVSKYAGSARETPAETTTTESPRSRRSTGPGGTGTTAEEPAGEAVPTSTEAAGTPAGEGGQGGGADGDATGGGRGGGRGGEPE